MAIKNQINSYADLTAYNADQTKEYPNVSYIVATNEVKWFNEEPADPIFAKCKYNVVDTENATTLATTTSNVTKQIIDGVEQQTVVSSYTFSTTGEHEVKYQFANNQISSIFFQNVAQLTSISLPSSLTTIGSSAFESCSGITKGIVIPSSVTSIGNGICGGSSVPSIYYESTTPVSGGSPGSNSNWDNITYVPAASLTAYKTAWSNDALRIFPYPQKTGAEISFKMAKDVSNANLFGNRQYAYFKDVYVNDVLQPSSKSITASTGDTVRCTLYDERTVPMFFNSYGYANGKMKQFVLPSTIETIPNETFAYTNNMISVTILATTPPEIGQRTFDSTGANFTIYVPAASVSAYQTAWSRYASIIQAIPTT